MGLGQAADALVALLGGKGPKARSGALLLASVLLAHRPKLPNVILDRGPGSGE